MAQVLRQVGRYEIVREVGRGGMAVVYLARQTDLDRNVALKELGAFYAGDESFAERFIRESRVAGSLSHPNIVTVHDFFEHDGVPYIAMEYLERGSLRPLIGRLTLAQVVGALEGLLAGLAHAAKRGIVHRDLKPENLMATAEGTIKITDFGISKALNDATARLTATGQAIGTPAYMAPEQVTGTGITASTDLYATGVIAFELLTGQVPFDHEESLTLLFRHVNEPAPDPRSIRPDVSPQLARWVTRLLAKNPLERPASPGEAWEALEEIAINTLGPRWRRESRLLDGDETVTAEPAPPEPAGFPQTTPMGAPGTKPAATPRPIEALPTPPSATTPGAPSAAVPRVRRSRRVLRPAGISAGLGVVGAAIAAAFLATGDPPPPPQPPPPPPDLQPQSSERFAVGAAGGSVYARAPGGTLARLSAEQLVRSSTFLAGPGSHGLATPAGVVAKSRFVYVADRHAIFKLMPKSLDPVAAFAFPDAVALVSGQFIKGAAAAVRKTKRGGALCEFRDVPRCIRLPFAPTGLGAVGTGYYVANGAAGTVVPYARVKDGFMARSPFRLGRAPRGRLAFADGKVYVPIERGVAVIDTATRRIRRIALPTTPAALATAGGRVFAALYASDGIAWINPTMRTHQLIDALTHPVDLAVDANGRTVYVISGRGKVVALDARTGVAGIRRASVVPRKPVATVRLSIPPAIRERGEQVEVRVPVRGGVLALSSIDLSDPAISDGAASFVILRGAVRISTAAGRGVSASGVTVRVRAAPGGALVSLNAASGAFVEMRAPDLQDQAIVVTLTKPPRPKTSGGGGGGGGGGEPCIIGTPGCPA